MKTELKIINENMGEAEYEMFISILDMENGFMNPVYSLSY